MSAPLRAFRSLCPLRQRRRIDVRGDQEDERERELVGMVTVFLGVTEDVQMHAVSGCVWGTASLSCFWLWATVWRPARQSERCAAAIDFGSSRRSQTGSCHGKKDAQILHSIPSIEVRSLACDVPCQHPVLHILSSSLFTCPRNSTSYCCAPLHHWPVPTSSCLDNSFVPSLFSSRLPLLLPYPFVW